jgi:DNA-binding CsgD family transcriptional regulator
VSQAAAAVPARVCDYHFERAGISIPAVHFVDDSAFCDRCFNGRALRRAGSTADEVRAARPRRANRPRAEIERAIFSRELLEIRAKVKQEKTEPLRFPSEITAAARDKKPRRSKRRRIRSVSAVRLRASKGDARTEPSVRQPLADAIPKGEPEPSPIHEPAQGERPQPDQRQCAKLSPRQMQCLGLVVKCMSNKEIAAELGVSERTVKYHVAGILGIVGLRRRAELIAWSLSSRLAISDGEAGDTLPRLIDETEKAVKEFADRITAAFASLRLALAKTQRPSL